MTEVQEPDELRVRKLEELNRLDLPLLPNRFENARPARDVVEAFDSLENSDVRVAGRLVRIRQMGKASFAHLQDRSGQVQLYFKRDDLGDQAYEYFKLLDIGDIVGVDGSVFKTRTGEPTVAVKSCVLLAKSHRPLPDKWHGLVDVETRYRRRYVDLIANDDARRVALARSRLVRGIREYLHSCGFIEVETPALQPVYGGAAAQPFVTHSQAMDMDVYLRIADELYLKRLIVGGLERVFEIGKDFRNEGFSRKHSPEFTMVELYQAYADYNDIMDLYEAMVSRAALDVLASHSVHFNEHDINLQPPWQRLSMHEAIQRYAGLDVGLGLERERLAELARDRNVTFEPNATRGKLMEDLFSELVEPHLIEPTFVYDYPVDYPGSLLAKRRHDAPHITERFEMFVGGMEIANGFTELNDPEDQRARMEEAAHLRGDEHADVDEDFLLALEYGMPPTGGIGFGIDRLTMVLTGVSQIRETILFPLMKPLEDDHVEP